MAYIVTKNILDSKDNHYLYEVGDTYPRPELTVSDKRLAELIELGVIVSDGEDEPVKPRRRRKTDTVEVGQEE